MKSCRIISFLLYMVIISCSPAFSEDANSLETLKNEFGKAVPKSFKLAESGVDGENLYAVYKKSAQELITVNLQKDHEIEFEDTESQNVNGHKTIFYYMGFEKSAGIVVFLKDCKGYLVVGYNKPYMGDEKVRKEELISIIEKVDISKFE